MAYNYSQYGGVLVERQKKVLTITLNSPETLNAFTGPMHTSMSRIWDDVNDEGRLNAPYSPANNGEYVTRQGR